MMRFHNAFSLTLTCVACLYILYYLYQNLNILQSWKLFVNKVLQTSIQLIVICMCHFEMKNSLSFFYLGFLRRFQHCTGHITTGSWKGRGNQYIQLVRVLYCKLPTNGKQLPAFPLKATLPLWPLISLSYFYIIMYQEAPF